MNICDDVIKSNRNRVFLKHRDKTYTYGNLEDSIDSICNNFKEFKIEGRIAFIGDRNIDYYAFVLACIRMDISAYIFYPTWTKDKISREIEQCNIGNIVFGYDQYNEEIDYSLNSYILHKSELIQKKNIQLNEFEEQHEEARIYLSTSGTTGDNKWNPYKIENIAGNLTVLADHLEISENDCIHIILPLYTSNGMTISFFLAFFKGASIFLDDEIDIFNISGYFDRGIKNGVTVVSLVPSVIRVLNRCGISKKDIQNNKVRFVICGTSSLKVEDGQIFEDTFDIPVYLNYGLTETLFISSQNKQFNQKGSSGKVLNGVIVNIENDEVRIKSPYVSENFAEINIEDNKYFISGDLGKIENQELFLIGRKKNQIVKNGYNINPNEVENIIMKFSGITDCYVFGCEDDISGEEIVCAIVINSEYDENEFIKYNNKHVTSYMRPKIMKVDRLPRNDMGKVLKSELIKKFKAETKGE